MNHNLPLSVAPLSSEALSQRRLDQLSVIAEKIHTQIPEFVGMTAFGSVVRGEARLDSDVDICVFMELSDAEQSAQNNPRVAPGEKIGPSVDLVGSYVFHPAIDLDYKAAIWETLPEDEIAEADIIVLPLDEGLLDTCTDSLLEFAKTYSKVTILQGLETLAPRNIRCLFNMPVDAERLQPYIERVLGNLAGNEYGERAWQMIRHMVVGFEQGREGNFADKPHRDIPETLDEALSHYSVTTGR